MIPLPARRRGLNPPVPPAEYSGARRAPLLILLAALGCSACGVQGTPRPPRIEQPQQVTDLSVVQVGRSLRLNFTLPRLATDGERLTKPQELEIVREVHPANEALPPSQARWDVWQAFVNADLEKHLRGDSVMVAMPFTGNEPPAARVQVAVRTVTRGFRNRPRTSELSNVITISLLQVPDAIKGLQAVTAEQAIELSWSAPGQTVSGYRLFRSLTGAEDSLSAIAETSGPEYHDADFEFGRAYFYKVSAIVKERGSVAESEESAAIEITPRDTFPPQPPKGLTALHTTDAVELIWSASPEADLRGYNVYREVEGSGASRLTPEPLSTPIYRDTNVAAGISYQYRVTALDTAGNESAPSDEAEAEVR